MAPRKLVSGVVPLAAALALLTPGAAFAQDDADPGGTRETATGPIELGQTASGAIGEPGDVDVFSIEISSAPVALNVAVAQTNTECELWATLLDAEGGELQTAYVPHEGAIRLNSLLVTDGRYYVSLSSGPHVTCGGARYSLEPSVEPIPLDPSPPPPGLNSLTSLLRCTAACDKARLLSQRMGNFKSRVRRASGSRKRRLAIRLARVKRAYFIALHESDRLCPGSRRPGS